MSLIETQLFPRSMFDMENWLDSSKGQSTLDMFDAFDELDTVMGRNLQWLIKPDFLLNQMIPRVQQKYRIVVDCLGFSPDTIKTEVVGNKVQVNGCDETREQGGDFSKREIHKTFTLPTNAEKEKLVSFMTLQGQLVIEVPLKETSTHLNQDLLPRVTKTSTGDKIVELDFQVPEGISTDHLHVNIKDRDLIVRGQQKIKATDSISKIYFYKRVNLPENTDLDNLKCTLNKNQKLHITAPLSSERQQRMVPIEMLKA